MSGPLAPYADGFRDDLGGRGYAARSIGGQMRLVAHLSAWLAGQELLVGGLTAEVVADFLRVRREAGHRAGVSGRAVAPLLGYLRGLGVVAQPGRRVPESAVEVLLEEFRRYLVEERGLAVASVRAYLRYAELFLAGLPAPLDAALAQLPAGQVTAFLVRQSDRHSAWHAKAVVTALRSLLRFLHIAGHIAHPLVWAVPSVPGWRLTTLPRAVCPEQVAAVLAGCDRAGAHGRRDYAIVLLLARLGLRAGEVSAIELDDLDWRAVSSPSGARAAGGRCCRCRSRSGRPWRTTSATGGRRIVRRAGCSSPCAPRSPAWPAGRCSRWSPAAASGPVSPRSGRTGCGTRWPAICSGGAPR